MFLPRSYIYYSTPLIIKQITKYWKNVVLVNNNNPFCIASQKSRLKYKFSHSLWLCLGGDLQQVDSGFAEQCLSCERDLRVCRPERQHKLKSFNLLWAKSGITVFSLLGKILNFSNNPQPGFNTDTEHLCTHSSRGKTPVCSYGT